MGSRFFFHYDTKLFPLFIFKWRGGYEIGKKATKTKNIYIDSYSDIHHYVNHSFIPEQIPSLPCKL